MTNETRVKILRAEKMEHKAKKLLAKARVALCEPGDADKANTLYLQAKTLHNQAQALWEQTGVL